MSEIKHARAEELPARHKCEHEGYEYFRRDFVPWSDGRRSLVSVYEIPPLKSAYPYHYHCKNEETFFILSGEGALKTPEGTKTVRAGELLFFPADSGGAHKLTNTSPTESLVYLDFDVIGDLDAAVYPDSGKVGLWGKDLNRVFRLEDARDYYDGE